MSLLDKINYPSDLKNLSEAELISLAADMRSFLIDSLNQCGGHFAGNLGTIELAIALHYIYNTPTDKLIWDVGHQAYPHKILTGRKDQLTSIRQTEGLAPFPKQTESEYDAFGVGHSSTSISAAVGMAEANKLLGNNDKAIAIIGDGAMTAGMAFEALNHAGDIKANMLVILNDNDMSISNNVGGLSNYVARMLAGKMYLNMRQGSKKVLSRMPKMSQLARRTEEHLKGMMVPGTLFEELGFNYIGPIDGHDLPSLLKTLSNIKDLKGPQFLHVLTQKGKGYAPAEADPIKYHAVKPGFNDAAKPAAKKAAAPTFSQIFGQWLCDMAAVDEQLVAITPAMREGSGLVEFQQQHPQKYFDVGIAEQHSVTFAAGLACQGLHPVVAIYSSFLQRAYDQLIHDVALQKLPVLFAIDRAGIVGGDGSTHNGAFDLSYLACIPNLIIMAPSNENECRQMLYTGYKYPGPVAVRYPRGGGNGTAIVKEFTQIEIGKAELVREGETVAILAFGSMVSAAELAAEQLDATLVNMRYVKPLDQSMIKRIAQTHSLIVTVEENAVNNGAGSLVNQCLVEQNSTCRVLNLGLPDHFIEHGDPAELLAQNGLSPQAILQQIQKTLTQDTCKNVSESVKSTD